MPTSVTMLSPASDGNLATLPASKYSHGMDAWPPRRTKRPPLGLTGPDLFARS